MSPICLKISPIFVMRNLQKITKGRKAYGTVKVFKFSTSLFLDIIIKYLLLE